MNILITGGAGFIGHHIVKLFIEDRCSVFVIDDYSTGSRQNHIKGVQYFEANISDTGELGRVMTTLAHNRRIDCLIHLAAKASIVPSVKNPKLYHRVNVGGTMSILQLASRLGVKRFIYTASGSCYGIPSEIPTTEQCPIGPQYPYAQTKYNAEQYALNFCEVNGISFISLRLFNVFGPRMCLSGGYGGLFSAILPQRFNNAEIVTIGDGEQSRDFVYVEDVACAFKLAAESDVSRAVFNIGSGKPVSVNEILKLLEIPESQIFRMPDRPGEPRKTQANFSHIKDVLGWQPEVSFADGLKVMIADVEYWRRAKVWTRQESIDSQKEWYAHFGQPLPS